MKCYNEEHVQNDDQKKMQLYIKDKMSGIKIQ